MNSQGQFYLCRHCRNLVGMIHDSGVPMICCGEVMSPLVPNTVDASLEKHVPAATIVGNTVSVQIGGIPHPMVEEHYIEWIYVETQKGGQRKNLEINGEPAAKFALVDDEVIAVYAHCNLHGLWKAEPRQGI